MAVKKTKTLAEVAAVTDVKQSEWIPFCDDYGNVNRIRLERFCDSVLEHMNLGSNVITKLGRGEGLSINIGSSFSDQGTLLEGSPLYVGTNPGEFGDEPFGLGIVIGSGLVQGENINIGRLGVRANPLCVKLGNGIMYDEYGAIEIDKKYILNLINGTSYEN